MQTTVSARPERRPAPIELLEEEVGGKALGAEAGDAGVELESAGWSGFILERRVGVNWSFVH